MERSIKREDRTISVQVSIQLEDITNLMYTMGYSDHQAINSILKCVEREILEQYRSEAHKKE